MAKKKWETVNINDFFAPEYGPPAPARLIQPPVRAKVRQSTIKIPKPGPMTPAGTQSSKKKSTKYKKIDMIGPEGVEDFEINEVSLSTKKTAEIPRKAALTDKLAMARAAGDREEETRILRILRNIDELKKLKRKPQKNSKREKQIRGQIRKDILADPDLERARAITRGVIDDAFNLEVDKLYDVKKGTWYADQPNAFTAERIAAGQSIRLSDVDTSHQTFKPVSPKQREASEMAKRQFAEMHRRAKALTSHQEAFFDEVEFMRGFMQGVPSSGKRSSLPPILKGMEKLGLPISNKLPQLEVMSVFPELASPVDKLTGLSVAEGRSRILGPMPLPNQSFDFNTPDYRKNVLELRNKPRLYEIQRLAQQGIISHTEKADMMMDALDKGFIKAQYPPQVSKNQVAKVSRIRVGRSILNERRELAEHEADNERYLERMQRAIESKQKKAEFAEHARLMAREKAERKVNISSDYIARYRATISSQEQASQVATRSTGRMTSSIAEQLGQDTLRAASVIHSSKMNYAAVGAAGLAAVFGITSLGRQRKNAEEEIQSRF